MKKFALLALVAVLSFGFVGCASSLERQWGMKDTEVGHIQSFQETKESSGGNVYTVYSVVIISNGRVSQQFRTSEPEFSGLKTGDEVRLELNHYVTDAGKVVSAVYFGSCSVINEAHGNPMLFYVEFK